MAMGRACAFYEGSEMRHGMMGINFPIQIYNQWRRTALKSLSKEEREVDEKILQHKKIEYVVACLMGDESSLRHELAHALYALDDLYRSTIDKIWQKLPHELDNHFSRDLMAKGYTEEHVVDEWQAYLVESHKGFGTRKFSRESLQLHKQLRLIYTESLDKLGK